MADELIAGRYELERRLGSGGMAAVFCAYDRRLERRVAVKVLHQQWSRDADYLERFRREARAVAQLNHQNIVTVIDRGEWQGRPFIVFEYIEGETLKQLVARSGPLPSSRALELAIDIGRGLAFAHRHGVVHRDVKPQNVLLVRDGEAKVTDFGIARSADLDELTLAGAIIGTSHYISPEQATGQAVDERTDVYSLGAVLFELLTGIVPFDGDGFIEVAMRHVTDPVPSVLERRPDAPPRVAAAVARALAKDPNSRFQSMDEFVRALESCLADPGEASDTQILVPVFTPEASLRHQRGRTRLLLAAVLLALAAGGTAGGLYFFGFQSQALKSHAPALSAPIRLRAVAAYDPSPGDGVEDNQRLPLATDGNPTSHWATEWYTNDQFGNLKQGVGVVLDAGKPTRLKTLTLTSNTPGFTAVVKASTSKSGPFQVVSQEQTVGRKTTFSLRRSAPREFYLLWITQLAPATGPHYQAHLNEVTAT